MPDASDHPSKLDKPEENFYSAAVSECFDKSARICRQGEVLFHGTGRAAAPDKVIAEIKKAPTESAVNAGASLLMGAGLAYIQRRFTLAGTVIGGIAGVVGIKALADTGIRLSNDKSLQQALKTAWLHGDKANMQKSKELATQIMAPEVAQLEVDAVAGGIGFGVHRGFAALRDKAFGLYWSKLLTRTVEFVNRKRTQYIGRLEGPAPQQALSANDRSLSQTYFECDEKGVPFTEATNTEKEIIRECVTQLRTQAPQSNPKVESVTRDGCKSLDLSIRTFPEEINPDYDPWTSGDRETLYSIEDKLRKEIKTGYGWDISFSEGLFHYRDFQKSAGTILKHNFLESESISPTWRISLVDIDEVVQWEFGGLGRPIVRPYDIERLVLECFRHHLREDRELSDMKFAAQRTLGCNSGRTLAPLILEIETTKTPTAELRQRLDVVIEKVYKQFRIRPSYRFVSPEQEGWIKDFESVPISPDHVFRKFREPA